MKRSCNLKMVEFGSLKALVSVQLEDIEIRGFKVIDQGEGKPWVGVPAREVTRDGKKEYYDIVRFADDDTRREFFSWILAAYRAEKGEGSKGGNGGSGGNGGNGSNGGNGGNGGHAKR
jgi:DNA-binding cell septation regulator SpoVG